VKLRTRIAYAVLPPYVWNILHDEAGLTWCRWSARWRIRSERIRKIIDGGGHRLHLGCGARIVPGWVNIDGTRREGVDLWWDVRSCLPFGDGAATAIYSEHLLEHLTKEDAIRLLRECHRVLAPGGKLRLGVPDAELYLRAYADGRAGFFERLERLGGAVVPLSTPIDVVNQMFRMGGHHRFAWDVVALTASLESIGFRVERWNPGEASSEGLCLDDPAHAFETLYVEATKAEDRRE
jgi:predicted SAM-dependent methyltransferase